MAPRIEYFLELSYRYSISPAEYLQLLRDYDLTGPAFLELMSVIEAGREENRIGNVASSLRADNGSVYEALLKVTRDIIFSPDRSYYQILGVSEAADTKALKRHYRVLMRVFHPDRKNASDGEQAEYARIINRAYNVLKKADSRKKYDQKCLEQSIRERQLDQEITSYKSPSFNKASRPTLGLASLYRNPGLVVYLGLGIVGVSLLWMLVGENNHEDRYSHYYQEVASKRDNRLPVTLKEVEIDTQNKAHRDILRETLSSPELNHLLIHTAPKNTEPVKQDREPMHYTEAGMMYGFDGAPVSDITDAEYILQNNIEVIADSDDRVHVIEPESLLVQYVQEYETGDLDGLLRLFSPTVITNHGAGKDVLIASYGKLFENTTFRTLEIKEVKVKHKNKAGAVMVSKIEAEIKPADSLESLRFDGDVVFRVISSNKGLQIAEMLHTVR